MSKKASQSFASADAKALLYVFCRDMCVAENTLRGVSVELSAISGQQRRRTKRFFLEKVAKPLFRQSQKHLPAGRCFYYRDAYESRRYSVSMMQRSSVSALSRFSGGSALILSASADQRTGAAAST